MVKQGSKEKRTSIRAKRVLSIVYKLDKTKRKNSDKTCYLSTTEDMSRGGVSFYSDHDYSKDDVLDIHVVMSGVLEIFRGLARVVRVEKTKSSECHLIAVQFIEGTQKKKRSAKSYTGEEKIEVKVKKKRI